MIRHIKTIVVILALTSGFSLFSQELPDAGLPENFRNVTAADTTSIAGIKWKDFFEEKDLVALIDAALSKNNELQLAEKNIGIARLRFNQAKWGNVPQINAFATAGTTSLSDNSLNGMSAGQFLGKGHIEDFSAGLNLSWEADIWGKISNRKKAAQAAYLQTAEVKKALQTVVMAHVANGFYDLLMMDAQLEIARKTLELNDRTLFAVNLQYEAGQVTLLAKEQTEAQRLATAKLIPELEKNIQLQENALSVLSGTFPQAKERNSKLEAIAVKNNLQAGVPAQLLSKRPDVKSAELNLKAANARVGITKAGLYPSLNITAVGGVNSFQASNWFSLPASIFGSVAAGLTAPLLNSRQLRTQYEVAKLERDQAMLQFRQAILVAVGEVSDALARIDKLQQQYDITEQRSATLRKAVENANLLFRSGMASYIEVNIAEGNLLQAELELALIKKERLSANVGLYRALGGGWE